MNREVTRLSSEWSTKLEIAWLDAEQEQLAVAREAEQNKVRTERTAPIKVPNTADRNLAVSPSKSLVVNTTRGEARKRKTVRKYESWQREYRRLIKAQPGMSDVWYSQKISRTEIADDRSAETIRKHMKK